MFAYVNGDFVPEDKASISIFDRGLLFSDGVYEVCTVLRGGLVDNDAHLARMGRSLAAMDLNSPVALDELPAIQKELIRRNGLEEGVVYVQITRGVGPRDFTIPDETTPSLVMFCQAKNLLQNPIADRGVKIVSVNDPRWKRRDIKTISLIGPVFAKQEARKKGGDDAWMVEDGLVTEGTSNNAYIVTADNHIVTRQLGQAILPGITRSAVLSLAAEQDLVIEERPFSMEEVYAAAEAFSTSASSFVIPVIEADGRKIGDGRPGPITKALRAHYIEFALKSAGSDNRAEA